MLVLIWLLYFSFGLVSASLAPLLSEIQSDLDISDALAGTALAAWQLVYVFFAIPAGAAIERLGLRRGLIAAGFIIALSQVLRATAGGYPALFLGVAVFGLGGPLISIGAPATVARWFSPREIAMATGIYSVAPPVGGVVALFSSNAVLMPLTGDSWRATLLVFASIAVVAAIAWTLFAREAVVPQAEDGPKGGGSLSRFLTVGRIGTVQIMLLMSIGIFLFSHGATNWLPTLLHRQGLSEANAGSLSSLPTIVGIFAALAITRAVGRGKGGELPLLALIFGTGALAAALVPVTRGYTQIGALVLMGVGLNSAMPLMMIMLMAMPRVGPRNMGIAGGLWFTFGEIGGVLGPSLVGAISRIAGLASGFYLLAGVSCWLLLMTFVLQLAFAQPGRRGIATE
jgi:cyanate permease